MGQPDICLRHLTQRHSADLARTILPGTEAVVVHGYLDSQLTHLERRLDKALGITLSADRRALHIEFEVDPDGKVPYRVFEYQSLFTIAHQNQHPRAPPLLIESIVLVLRGPKRPWPEEDSFRLSWPERPFAGARFRIEPVYQRTVAELRARASPFWLALTPLAKDATPAMLTEVIVEIRTTVSDHSARADIFAVMLVMADLDPWDKQLRKEIETMLQSDKDSWDFMLRESVTLRRAFDHGVEKGKQEGFEVGVDQTLRMIFAQRIGREPSPDEQLGIEARARLLGVERALRFMLQLPAEALKLWLEQPTPS